MSSPLDGRIRKLAREEAQEVARGTGGDSAAPDVPALQQQITDLHEHLHHTATTISRLEARIDALEKPTELANQEDRPAVRRTRKASE